MKCTRTHHTLPPSCYSCIRSHLQNTRLSQTFVSIATDLVHFFTCTIFTFGRVSLSFACIVLHHFFSVAPVGTWQGAHLWAANTIVKNAEASIWQLPHWFLAICILLIRHIRRHIRPVSSGYHCRNINLFEHKNKEQINSPRRMLPWRIRAGV